MARPAALHWRGPRHRTGTPAPLWLLFIGRPEGPRWGTDLSVRGVLPWASHDQCSVGSDTSPSSLLSASPRAPEASLGTTELTISFPSLIIKGLPRAPWPGIQRPTHFSQPHFSSLLLWAYTPATSPLYVLSPQPRTPFFLFFFFFNLVNFYSSFKAQFKCHLQMVFPEPPHNQTQTEWTPPAFTGFLYCGYLHIISSFGWEAFSGQGCALFLSRPQCPPGLISWAALPTCPEDLPMSFGPALTPTRTKASPLR